MDAPPPPGFVPVDLGPGFGAGFGPVFVDRERRLLGFRVLERHLNPVGACHGGALTTFADMQLIAVRRGGEGRPHAPTVSLAVDFLAPAKAGAWVEAQVTLLQRGRTLFFTQALMTVEGEPVARSSAVYRNYDPADGG